MSKTLNDIHTELKESAIIVKKVTIWGNTCLLIPYVYRPNAEMAMEEQFDIYESCGISVTLLPPIAGGLHIICISHDDVNNQKKNT